MSDLLYTETESEADALLEQGLALQAEHPHEALALFVRALDRSPNHAMIHDALGRTFAALGDTKRATEHGSQAARLAPYCREIILSAGEILTSAGKFGQAQSFYSRYLKRHPGDSTVSQAAASTESVRAETFRPPPGPLDLNLQPVYRDQKLEAVRSFVRFMRGEELPAYPLDIFLEVSNVCNLKCVMCETFSSLNPSRHRNIAGTDRGFLNHQVLEPLEDLLKHALKVHCFGYGEATVNPHFREFIQFLGKYEVFVDFFSNGMRLTEDLVDFLVDNFVGEITISFSGSTKEEYEQIYQGGVFETVLSGLKRLRDRKRMAHRQWPRIAINSLAFVHHVATFDRFVELMAEHGANVIYLKPLLAQGERLPALVGHSGLLTPEIVETVIARARAIACEHNISLSLAPELFVSTQEEAYSRLLDFSGLSETAFGSDREIVSVHHFKDLARATKQETTNAHEPIDPPTFDLDNDPQDMISAMLGVGNSPHARWNGEHFYCMEPFKTLYVLQNGQTKPCCNVPSQTPPLGNVLTHGGMRVWTGKGFATYRSSILQGRYPLRGCAQCLHNKVGPKTHFVDQMYDEYRAWHSSIFRNTLPLDLIGEVRSLGDGSTIASRWNSPGVHT